MIMPGCSALTAHGFQDRARAVAFGAFGASFGLGTAIGPLIGGLSQATVERRWKTGAWKCSAASLMEAGTASSIVRPPMC